MLNLSKAPWLLSVVALAAMVSVPTASRATEDPVGEWVTDPELDEILASRAKCGATASACIHFFNPPAGSNGPGEVDGYLVQKVLVTRRLCDCEPGQWYPPISASTTNCTPETVVYWEVFTVNASPLIRTTSIQRADRFSMPTYGFDAGSSIKSGTAKWIPAGTAAFAALTEDLRDPNQWNPYSEAEDGKSNKIELPPGSPIPPERTPGSGVLPNTMDRPAVLDLGPENGVIQAPSHLAHLWWLCCEPDNAFRIGCTP